MTPSEKILQTALQWSEGEITDAEFMRHIEADVTAAVAAERKACASLVDGWHISKGGYSEMAYQIRERGKGER